MADALQAMLALAARTLAEEEFAAWLRERLRKTGGAPGIDRTGG